ncbi:MAG: SMC family ATPase [Leptolyngbyaceae cyanobacterium SL_7_1]|nr:SMC family ATPase [Leptolyngbyaceae cyanobacterium SL_7_1]
MFDPQLGQRLEYKHIDEEVMPWLRQQFGVAPGTNLSKLFANTIGVPQGTFTVDFLQTAENRRKVFDTILKVEDYKLAYTQLNSLEKYARAAADLLEQSIAQYTEELQALTPLQHQHQQVSQEIADNQATLHSLHAQLEQLQQEKDRLTTQAKLIEQLEQQLTGLKMQINTHQQTHQLLQHSVDRAQQAAAVCSSQQSSYEAFLSAEAVLLDLDRHLKQRQTLLTQRDALQQQLTAGQGALTRLQLQLESLNLAQQEITTLQPLVQSQHTLEAAQASIIETLQRLQAARLEYQALTKHLDKLQGELERLTIEIQRIHALQGEVAQLDALEQQRHRLQEQLSRIDAAKQFELDLRRLVEVGEQERDRHHTQAEQALTTLRQIQQSVPLLATAAVDQALQAIEAGMGINQALLRSLQGILADLAEQTATTKLHHHLDTLNTQIKSLYHYQAEVATLEAKVLQSNQLRQEIEQYQTQLTALQQTLADEIELQTQRSHLGDQLDALNDPRSRIQLLQRSLTQQSTLNAAYDSAQQNQAVLEKQLHELEDQLGQFAELDQAVDTQKHQRQLHQSGYLCYLQSKPDADRWQSLTAELATATTQLNALQTKLTDYQQHCETAYQSYDPQEQQRVEAIYTDTRSQADRLLGSLPQQQKLLQELDRRLRALQEIGEKRDRAQRIFKQKQRISKFIRFSRDAYKKAGPRITERYIQSISREADRLFRELLNRPNVALEWTRDYEILVQEGAHLRRFINLSGGEQMCAALAVRLALLRVLADIDVAFLMNPPPTWIVPVGRVWRRRSPIFAVSANCL